MQIVQNMQNIQIILRPALISPSPGSSCRTSCSSSAHPPLAISVSREEELQLLASPGNRVAKVVIDQLGQLVSLVVVMMFMLMFVLICVVRFLNPVSPTCIVPLTMFLSNLMYTWTAKKTSVSLWKKRIPHAHRPKSVPASPSMPRSLLSNMRVQISSAWQGSSSSKSKVGSKCQRQNQ